MRDLQTGDKVRFTQETDRASAYTDANEFRAFCVKVDAVAVVERLYTFENNFGTHYLCDVRLLDGTLVSTNVLCVELLENL